MNHACVSKLQCMFFVVLAVLQPCLFAESPKVARTRAPAWVKPQAVDYALHSKDGLASAGLWDLLIDVQTNAADKTTCFHYATQFLTQSGVEDGSRLSISFDPSYETLSLNKLMVCRNGKIVDRLATQEIKLLHREEGLDRLLYDGRLSAGMILDDIRVGDIIEYTYTLRGANPIFEGRYFHSFSTRWSAPVQRVYQRLLWPADRKLAIKSFGEDLKPVITQQGGTAEYVWEKSDIAALSSDGNLPSWFDPYGWVQLSEFQTWNDVARWACKLFVVQEKAAGRLRGQVDLIKPIGDRKKQAIAALRFVQDNIRYLGIEVGAHSHKPYPIDVVLERRFGDCKDKALLLCTLLRQLGFEAYPALVATDSRQSIMDWLPTPLAFDHLIVQLRLDGHTYWLDPTRSNQGGGLDEVHFPNYGVALVAREDTDALTKIVPQGFGLSKKEIVESYEIPDFKGGASLKVRSVFSGREADGMRGWLADSSAEEIKKAYLNYYAKQYPHIESAAPVEYTDDLEKNEIVTNESYRILQFWQPHADDKAHLYGEFYAQLTRDVFSKPRNSVRTMPFALAYPVRLKQTIRIQFPKTMNFTAEKIAVDDQSFKFSYERASRDKELSLSFAYESLQDHVDAARISDYLKNVRQSLENLEYQVWFDKELAKGIPSPSSATAPAITPVADDGLGTLQKWLLVSPFILVGILRLAWYLRQRFRRPPPSSSHLHTSLHRCALCGKTELTAPDLDFRVAFDGEEYCHPHLPKTR